MRRGAVTIKDVAEAAGVHVSTVSRALSPATRHLISAEIAARIDSVASELGYARNAIASSLRTRSLSSDTSTRAVECDAGS